MPCTFFYGFLVPNILPLLSKLAFYSEIAPRSAVIVVGVVGGVGFWGFWRLGFLGNWGGCSSCEFLLFLVTEW